MVEIRCPHCNEVFWNSEEDSVDEINALIRVGTSPFIPYECHYCEDLFWLRAVVTRTFEVSPDDVDENVTEL